MRRLSPGDVTRKLADIENSPRGSRWKKRAKAHLLKDVGAKPVGDSDHLSINTGRICAKRRFPTFTAAMEALIETWQSTSPRRREKRVHPCKHCKGWHLTSRPLHEGKDYDHRQARYLEDHGITGPGDCQGQHREDTGQGHRDTQGH